MSKKVTPKEHQEQANFVEWCRLNGIAVVSVPNGFFAPRKNGKPDGRFFGQLNKLKAEGYSAGFPDLLVFLKGKLLIIEMKRKQGGVVGDDQLYWHKKLKMLGFHVAVCKGFESAVDYVSGHLDKK